MTELLHSGDRIFSRQISPDLNDQNMNVCTDLSYFQLDVLTYMSAEEIFTS